LAEPTPAIPLSGDGPTAQAARHLAAGRTGAAETLYREALQANPNDRRAIAGMGALALRQGDAARALELFGRAASLDPKDAEAAVNLGVAYQALNRIDEAETCFRRSITLAPDLLPPRVNLASILAATGRSDAAIEQLEDAIGIDPDSADCRFNLGNILLASGRTRDAETRYREALARNPDHLGAWNNLGLVCKTVGDLDAAASHLSEARLRDPDNPQILANLADALTLLGRGEEAETLARRAVTLAPNTAARTALGAVLTNLGRLEEATQEYAAAVKADPKSPTPPHHLAVLMRRRGRYAAALTAADRAVSLARAPGPHHLLRAEIALALGRTDLAWDSLDALADGTAPLDLSSLAGRRLRLVATEPSPALFGLRFLPILTEAGARVEIVCPPVLADLFHRLCPDLSVTAADRLATGRLADGVDHAIGFRDLPRILRAGVVAPAPLPDELAERLTDPANVPRRVGLWWEGDHLTPDPNPILAALPSDARPVILQTGDARAALSAESRAGVSDVGERIETYGALMEAMLSVDHLVVADGAAAHLAASLGKPTIVLGGRDRPWSWRDRGPGDESGADWYPAATALWQDPDGGWQSALRALPRHLTETG